ncbi:cation acetate symporter [Streptomyces piniterrae]|uniref:Cation acetate symporter n=1 Tax=Streptomyces piniterrae TaxID=2571125 RepID=A0A4U0NIG0_9ACTN|nr:cation acetate symporter [Streptomyces piniterrae]TJZ54061.1 cation acetate symporter [Streptomyces piniterrae]
MTDFDSGTQSTVLVIFTVLVTLTLLICVISGPDRDDLPNFYTGYLSLTPFKNGLAIAGDYISAATVLSTTGIIALAGYDGFLLAMSTALSLVLLMFLLAEPLRNAGTYTMGDVLSRTVPGSGRSVRIASSVVTLIASVPFLIVQLSGAGSLLTFILDIPLDGARTASIVIVGTLMIIYAALGGMRGTAIIQMIKIVLLLGTSAIVAFLVLNRFDWSIDDLLQTAQRGSGAGPAYLEQGVQLGQSGSAKLDFISLQITILLGVGCLPHITMRLYSARNAKAVRRSMSWAVGAVTTFCLLVIFIGTGAAALVGAREITAADPQGRTSVLLLSRVLGASSSLGETLLYAAVAGTVFITLLSSVAGMTLAAANSLAHDLFAGVIRAGRARPRTEMNVAGWASVAVGTLAIVLAVMVQDWNVGVLTTTAICVGASAVAPALTYSLFWRGYTRTGLLATLYGGTASVLFVMAFSKAVSGSPDAVFPDMDFQWFPLQTSGLISIPVGYLAGWLGSRLDRRYRAAVSTESRRRYEEGEARLLAAAD